MTGFCLGVAFAALGLAVNALANGYDFFSYYMTLVLTPMPSAFICEAAS